MKTKLFFLMLFISLSAVGQQISELSRGLIFRAPLSEWNPTRDEVSNTVGTATDTYNVIDRQGSGRRELTYNGSTSYTTLPTIPAFGTGDFTVVMKVRFNDINKPQIFLGSYYSFGLTMYLGNLYRGKIGVGSDAQEIQTTFIQDREYIIAYKRSGTTGTFAINGNQTTSVTDNINYENSVTQIGFYSSATYALNGSISLVRIFNYALTPTQIANYSRPECPIEWVDRIVTAGELVTNGTFTGSATGWELNGGAAYGTNNIAITSSGGLYQTVSSLTATKKYRSTFNISGWSTGKVQIQTFDGTLMYSAQPTGSTMAASADFTWAASTYGTRFYMQTNGAATLSLDNVSLVQLGCVLDLNAEGMTSGYWYDKTNSLTATNSGTTLVIPPASNLGGTSFNGTTSKVVFTGMTALTGDVSVSIWYRQLSIPSNLASLFTTGASDLNIFVDPGLYAVNGLVIRHGGGNYWYATPIANNVNYNIIYTNKSGIGKIYINGVEVTTGSSGTYSQPSGTTYTLGLYTGGGAYIDGLISNENAWSRILSQDEIRLIYDTNF